MTCSTTEPSRDAMRLMVVEWIIAGMRSSQIPDHAKKTGWDIDADQVRDLILEANDILWSDTKIDPQAEQAKAIARLNHIHTRSLAIQDYKTALSAQKELNLIVARASNPFNKP